MMLICRPPARSLETSRTRNRNTTCSGLIIITYRLFALAKTDAEYCNAYPHMQPDSGKFAFSFCSPQGRRQESYLRVPRLYKECGP